MLDYKIYTFLELCKYMNYRITAEKLNMTQPAVTNHIKQLENQYNCTLFTYQNRVLRKTVHAEILQNYALSADYNAKNLIHDLTISKNPTLKIGATKTIGEFLLSDKISKLLQSEKIELTYIVDNTEVLLYKLRNGELDFVFIEGFFNKAEFVHFPFIIDELVGICSKNHHFANKTVEFSDILGEQLILRELGSGTRRAFENTMSEQNLTIDAFKNKIQTNSFSTILDLVSKDIGISFVYSSIANKSPFVSSFRINNLNIHHEFSCIHLKNINRPRFLEFFIEM